MPDPRASGPDAGPKRCGSGRRTLKIWVVMPVSRALDSDAKPWSLGPGGATRPKGLGSVLLPHLSNLD